MYDLDGIVNCLLSKCVYQIVKPSILALVDMESEDAFCAKSMDFFQKKISCGIIYRITVIKL